MDAKKTAILTGAALAGAGVLASRLRGANLHERCRARCAATAQQRAVDDASCKRGMCHAA